MSYETVETRVDRLEALFGHFLTQMALIERRAEERNQAAEARIARLEEEMRAFKDEMRAFKDEMRQSQKEMNKKWGDLANKMGTIVEDILAPNLRRVAREHFKFSEITYFAIRCERARHDNVSVKCEFDAVVAGPEAVILGEARSTPRLEDPDKFAEKGADFFRFFPELSGRRLILVFGSWSIPENVVGGLTGRGIYAMQMGDETMELVNASELER
ncbi:MAG: hypothetical protein QHJ82_05300 [Verrucomicrobiota bacterium]|nr:hypothetical protein [Verrucomicrobiota bacterium]